MDAHSWDERYRSARSGQMKSGLWSTQPHKRLQSIVDAMTPGTALDLASGDGRNAIWLAHRGWEVTAVDFSAEGLAIAQARAEAVGVPIDWQLGDVTDWQTSRRFQLIAVTYLHLDKAANIKVLQRASRWLVPGGTLLVIGHDKENLSRGTGGPQDQSILYSPKMLGDAVAGLTIIAAEQIIRSTSADPEGCAEAGSHAVDTLLHAVNSQAREVLTGR